MTEHHHFVQHILRGGDYVQTVFTCIAPEGSPCRTGCKTCIDEQRERCECDFYDEFDNSRKPDIQDLGACGWLPWLTEDAPEEMYNGPENTAVRGPGPQPINFEWGSDGAEGWEYAT